MMMPPMLQVPGPPMQLPPPPPPPPPQQQQQPPPKYQQQAFQGHRSPGNYMVQIRHQMLASQGMLFDGKRMRKAVHRKTIDYNSSVVRYLENRLWQRDSRDFRAFQPDCLYQEQLVPPLSMLHNPMNCVVTKFVRTSTNKFRCPIFVLTWTPEGRRLVTGASSGEFTLWNGLTFNFETILQAHDSSVRAMMWSHNDTWMVTGDHAGYIKYWQSNMNNVKMFQGHKEPVRGISFCPLDNKFTTCSDDGTVRIWDFQKCHEEKILRGHGADVKCVDWHPQKALIASGSKDNQQPIKLWDPKSGQSLATIHAHKSTVMELKWNRNGNWLLTASRDHLLKLFDIRNMREEMQTFRGHKKEATAIGWHPIHEGLFASGGSDGAIMFWMVGTDKEVGGMEEAHEGMVWSLAWHPMGHILASGSNDHSTKFWTRNRPGDKMRDRYNLNTLPVGVDQENDYDLDQLSMPSLPGMGLDQGSQMENVHIQESCSEIDLPSIPGLDWEADEQYLKQQEAKIPRKRVPYARPVPKQFEQAWLGNKQTGGVHAPDQKEMQKKQGMSQQASSDNTEQPQSNQAPPHMMKGNMLMPPSVGPLQPPLTLGPMGQVVTSVPPGPQSNMMAPPPGVPPVSVPLSRFPPQFPPGQYPNQMPRSSNMGPPPRAGFGGPHMIHGGSPQMMHPNQHMQQPPIRPGSEQQHQLRPDGPSPQQSMFASPPDQGLHPGRWMPQPDNSSEEGSSKDQDYRQINNNQTDGNFTGRGRGGNPPRGRHDMGARNRGRGQPFYNNAPPGQERTDHWQGNGKQGDENQYISKESNFANDIDERVDRGRGRNFPRGRGRGGYGNVQHMSNIPPHHQDIDERVMMVEHGHPSMKDMQGMDNQNPRKKPWEDGNQHLRGRGGGKGPHRGSLDPRAAKFSRQDHQGDFSGGGNMYNQDLPGQRSGYRGGRGRGGDRGRGYYRGGRGR